MDIENAVKHKYEEAYNLHYKEGNLEKAKGLYEKLIEQFPNSPEAGFALSQLKNIDKKKEIEEAAKQFPSNPAAEIKLTTAHSLEGYRVTKTIDVITAEYVFAMSVLQDISLGVKALMGGRSSTPQTALKSARRTCLSELRKEALSIGADAVIAVSLAYSKIFPEGVLLLLASGTAVNIEKIKV